LLINQMCNWHLVVERDILYVGQHIIARRERRMCTGHQPNANNNVWLYFYALRLQAIMTYSY